MASKAIANAFRIIPKRGYSLALSPSPKQATLETQILQNNAFVAALNNGCPLTRVTVAFKAGSRYEVPSEVGLAHVLRAAAGLTTDTVSSFIIQRKLAQLGASVHASGDREFIYYTLETIGANLNDALYILQNMVSNQQFRPWELDDMAPRLMYDITGQSPQVRCVDLLHKAAFRRGLGNSLFISERRIGDISSETLKLYTNTMFKPQRMAVTIVGDTLDKATLLAQSIQLDITTTQEPKHEPTQYYGGEQRHETGGPLAHVAVATTGAPAGTRESLALAIAARAIGCGPVTKWGTDNSVLARAAGNIGVFAGAGFNVSYSDGGLYGAVLSVPAKQAHTAVKAAGDMIRNAPFDSKTLAAARNQLKVQLMTEADSGHCYSEFIAAQGLLSGKARIPAQIFADIDQIDDTFICSTIKSLDCRLSMGAVGNLTSTPYVDEL